MATKKTPNTPEPSAPPKDSQATEGQAEGSNKRGVKLRVMTRLERHVRAGIEFRKGETEVVVSPKQAARLKDDKHLNVEPA